MRSFETGFLDAQPKPMGLVRTLTLLAEAKGKEALFARQSPQTLATLRDLASVQSTESSNRIEAIVAPPSRIAALVHERTTPRDRSEQEIAGYRDVLKTIHANYADMPFTPGLVLQLHRDLYAYSPAEGGRWKPNDNEITAAHPDGTIEVRFKAVSAVETPIAMAQLHEAFETLRASENAEPLLLIPAYVLDFLCIHPFADGNGRMARLLTLLLLYQSGYHVGRYISLEKIVEDTKEGYYDTLYRSSVSWHEGKHSLAPWWEYFLGVVLLTASRQFEERVGTISEGRGAKRDRVVEAISRLSRTFRIAEVEAECPGVSRPTITRTLYAMRDDGAIRCLGKGRDASWEKT
jgi:Fic family protein